MTFTFKSQEDKKNFLKIRIEYSGLSKPVADLLLKADIRTVGGILSHSNSELKKLAGIDDRDLVSLRSQLDQSASEFVEESNIKYPKITINDLEYKNKQLSLDGEDDIVGALSHYFGADKSVILSHTRKQDAVRVRDYIAYLLREYAGMSYPVIGQLLGGRDHTTIMHAYGKVKSNIQKNKELNDIFEGIVDKVSEIKERKLKLEEELLATAASFMKSVPFRREAVIKEISPRDLKALELYREGITLQNIADVIGVSRERARQIIVHVIQQQALNESISKGITIDSDILLEEELNKRNIIKKSKIEEKKPKTNKEKRWSRYYVACKSCGTVALPHVRNGLCEKCVGQYRSTRREEIVLRHGSSCDSCGMSRTEALRVYGRDFYITKDQRLYCRGCFAKYSGKQLGSYKNYEWSRFHPACISCGTTTVPHKKKGLCINCSDFLTNEDRERVIKQHGSTCDNCGISRISAKSQYKRDFYITKTSKVLCRKCFQGHARWGLNQKQTKKQLEKAEK